MRQDRNTIIVGIAGGTASGKSTLAAILKSRLEERALRCAAIATDAYFRRSDPTAPKLYWSHIGEETFDCNHIESADMPRLASDLDTLAAGVDGPDVILVEGLMILASSVVRERCDLKVFVELEPDIRLGRRLLRDIRSERGFGEPEKVVSYYLESARIGHERYVEPSRVYADVTVRGDADFDHVAEILLPSIQRLSNGKG